MKSKVFRISWDERLGEKAIDKEYLKALLDNNMALQDFLLQVQELPLEQEPSHPKELKDKANKVVEDILKEEAKHPTPQYCKCKNPNPHMVTDNCGSAMICWNNTCGLPIQPKGERIESLGYNLRESELVEKLNQLIDRVNKLEEKI